MKYTIECYSHVLSSLESTVYSMQIAKLGGLCNKFRETVKWLSMLLYQNTFHGNFRWIEAENEWAFSECDMEKVFELANSTTVWESFSAWKGSQLNICLYSGFGLSSKQTLYNIVGTLKINFDWKRLIFD